jgi:hypothetical protein
MKGMPQAVILKAGTFASEIKVNALADHWQNI